MNFDVHNSDDIDIIEHEINTPASVISLEEIDRILDPRSVTKHECVMNKVNEIQVTTERCTSKRPAYLDIDRICSHYVIHYMKRCVLIQYSKATSPSIIFRGTWDYLIPELSSEDLAKVEGFQCKICEKIFK